VSNSPSANPNGTPGGGAGVDPAKEVKKPEENKAGSPATSIQEKLPTEGKQIPAPQAVQGAAETDKNK
jgi:hypothetical protein